MNEVWLVWEFEGGPCRDDFKFINVDSVWSTPELAVRHIEDRLGAVVDDPGLKPEESAWHDDGHCYFVDRYGLDRRYV